MPNKSFKGKHVFSLHSEKNLPIILSCDVLVINKCFIVYVKLNRYLKCVSLKCSILALVTIGHS